MRQVITLRFIKCAHGCLYLFERRGNDPSWQFDSSVLKISSDQLELELDDVRNPVYFLSRRIDGIFSCYSRYRHHRNIRYNGICENAGKGAVPTVIARVATSDLGLTLHSLSSLSGSGSQRSTQITP
jgi:hypothetical protein